MSTCQVVNIKQIQKPDVAECYRESTSRIDSSSYLEISASPFSEGDPVRFMGRNFPQTNSVDKNLKPF